ncbi:MAG: hypothetical protein AAGL98_08235, partial [Planctomycetota bacterium]
HADDRQPVGVPAWGGTVSVVPLSLGDIRAASREAESSGIAEMSLWIARSVVQDDGSRLFTDADAKAIDRMKLPDLRPVTEAINSINGFDDDDVEGKSETTKGSASNSS